MQRWLTFTLMGCGLHPAHAGMAAAALRVLFWLVVVVCLSLVLMTMARAEVEGYSAPRMSLLPAQDHCFAVVEVKNWAGVYNNVETLTTIEGDVSVRYKTVGGHNPQDADLVDVMDLPDGVAAHPMHIDLPDGDNGYICLMKYQPA